jgi:uncharacterized protein YndB with AHSA1/START domain
MQIMTGLGVARRVSDGVEVTFDRHVQHSLARVWAMLTEPDNIRKWFCARVDIEPRVRGRIVEHHDHVGVDVHGEVTRWEPPRFFEHTWWFGDPWGTPLGSVRWELLPEASGTRVVLTHRRGSLDPGGMSGAHASLDVLCAVLDGGDPDEHAAPAGVFRNGEFVQTHPGRGRWADREALEKEYDRYFATV